MIIALEGLDGSGKSTAAKMLATGFSKSVVLRDPGTTPYGEKARELLLDPRVRMTPIQMTLFFMSTHDSLMCHAEEWEKQNPDGLVILDRCFISTLAYQSAGGVPFNDIMHIGRVSGVFRIPPENIYFLFVNEQERKKRLSAAGDRGKDRFESKGQEFYKKVAEGYAKAGEEWGYTTIDGFGTPHEVASRIYNKLDGTKVLKVW